MTDRALKGQTVLLTGALGTLGRAQASLFSQAGTTLILLDRPDAAEAGTSMAASIGGGARYIGLDLGDLAGSEQAIKDIAQRTPIDILVNNAALIINRPFEDFSLADYEDQIRVNSSAVFALTRAVAPQMKARGYGKIVNFCSLVLNGRWDGYVPYVASKGAVLGLTKSLARELGPFGIRVNAIAPGAVVSEAEERVFGDRLQQYNDWILENQSLKQRIQPEAVANLALFLAGPQSDMITGQILGIDGGW
jgi:NAD(P)-dependent dehydrogenase (short-subunit alcohol dehydrogenase family)